MTWASDIRALVEVQDARLPNLFPADALGNAAENSPSTWDPTIHEGGPDGGPGSCLLLGKAFRRLMGSDWSNSSADSLSTMQDI